MRYLVALLIATYLGLLAFVVFDRYEKITGRLDALELDMRQHHLEHGD